ncbi:MAG TPA: type II secretion system protein GspE [Bacteroidetes bacterium]|nr:type II secretion system protein GspE [Bacteroidota bacterium]
MLKKNDDKLESLLLEKGVTTPERLEQARREQQKNGGSLATILIDNGMARAEEVLTCLAEQLELPYVELNDYSIDARAIERLPKEIAWDCRVMPIFIIGNVMTVATSNPEDVAMIDRLRRATRMEIEPVISTAEEIIAALESHYGSNVVLDNSIDEVIQELEEDEPEQEETPEKIRELAEDAPVIKLVNLIIGQAIKDGASDIHIGPEEDRLMVRYRVDGVLREVFSPPKSLQAALISRIKILSELDIAETRAPQDGRFQARFEDKTIDLRVSTLPTVYGENIVMRLLDKSSLMINLEDIGLEKDVLGQLHEILASSYGIILVTGPTGSGKTTTLYSCLNTMNTPEKNIITIEDPVEYRLKLIRQAQVNPKAGLTFSAGLRSILRQDPDVVMVGEIRDSETAKVAVEAALTGHLVLSTLHTNDAPGAITRLIEMGVEPFLVASATVGVIAQRLVRKICPKCRAPFEPSDDLLRGIGVAPAGKKWQFYKGAGCSHCRGTGYRGRVGIYEIMRMNEQLRSLCLQNASSDALKKMALQTGMRTLRQDGFLKVVKGITTIEEVIRATNVET